MHPVEMIRGFLADLWRLPVLFKLVVLYKVGAFGWQFWKKRQHDHMLMESVGWPVYRARVVWAQSMGRKGGGEDGPSYWEGVLTYSYTVPGCEVEVGEFRKKFDDEGQAAGWARALRDKFVEVRVDPEDPKRSVWQETAGAYVPAPMVKVDAGGGGWSLPVFVVFCVSFVGTGLSLWIQLGSVLGRPVILLEKHSGMFFGMHVGAIGCAIAGSLAASRGKLSGMPTQRQLFEKGSLGARALQVLGAYYGIVFLYGWVRAVAHPGAKGGWPVLMFSAGWLLFYASTAANCWRSLQGQAAE